MKTVVVTGGTDGIGKAVAETLLERGDRVVIIGRDQAKGDALVRRDPERATFLRADLSSIAENYRVIDELVAGQLDALVFCARFYRTTRAESVDGLEDNFALFYLSRYLMGYGLLPALERSPRPVIVNAAGPGGKLSLVDWDDLQAVRGYDGTRVMFQGGKLNDLLGVTHTTRSTVPYVLYHPGTTATSFAGEYDPETAVFIEQMRHQAKPAQVAADPIVALINDPPPVPLSAWLLSDQLAVDTPDYSTSAADRLDRYTADLLRSLQVARLH